MSAVWYMARGTQQIGPMTIDDLAKQLPSALGAQTLVFGPGMTAWTEARDVPALAAVMNEPGARASSAGGPPPINNHRRADEIDYKIFGDDMQYIEVTLDPGEMAIAEPGAMFHMSSGIQMQTQFGDPSNPNQAGFLGKLVTAGKRMITGESLFMTTFSNAAPHGRQVVAFAAPYPGKIIPLDLSALGGEMICQKDSFLAAARGVSISIAFQKKIGVALFGGEGFIMQRLSGAGLAFVHAGGTLCKKTLGAGEVLKLDTGCLVALHPSVKYDIQFTGGFKNTLFGGEGLFIATLTGPGDVWLQSLPLSRLAGRIYAAAPQSGRGGREEGSLLGGIGRLLDGDNS